jgi:predicted trehalose synthase
VTVRLATEELLASLEPWLVRQRWFAGKAREVASVHLQGMVDLDDRVLDVILRVHYADGGTEDYQVPVIVGEDGFSDALADPGACRAIAALCMRADHRPAQSGSELVGQPVTDDPVPAGEVRTLGVEQSNSSVVMGGQAILKVFRKLEPGTNPDVELTRALTEADFPHVPVQRGSLDLASADEPPTTLAVLSDFLPDAQEGWALALAEPDLLLGRLGDLGRAVAGAHVVLAEHFPSRAATPGDGEAWTGAMLHQLDAVLATAARDPDRTAAVLARADDIRMRLRAGTGAPGHGRVQRIHGDLHLGQVLIDPNRGWQLLDFEGEPARSLADRRQPHSPLRDVAGMLRSFDYAAAHSDASTAWVEQARTAFLAGYGVQTTPLLVAFELDKAIYELGYELANRPDWVGIPVRGILRVLDG